MRFVELFAGIGGFSLGFERAGMECVGHVEINPYAQKVLHKHWPDVPLFGDVRTVKGYEFGNVSLVCGGFPCTNLSNARYGDKTDLKGSESSLFFEMARIIKAAAPTWIVFENVPKLLKYIDVIKEELPDYNFISKVLEASYYGVCCRRKRAFIAGHFRRECPEKIFNIPQKRCETVQSGGQEDIFPMCLPWKGGPSLERLSSCIVENTEINPTGIREGNGVPRRMDGHRYLMLGNAVVPQIAELIGRMIIEADKIMNKQEVATHGSKK